MLWTDVPVLASEENQFTKQEPHSDNSTEEAACSWISWWFLKTFEEAVNLVSIFENLHQQMWTTAWKFCLNAGCQQWKVVFIIEVTVFAPVCSELSCRVSHLFTTWLNSPALPHGSSHQPALLPRPALQPGLISPSGLEKETETFFLTTRTCWIAVALHVAHQTLWTFPQRLKEGRGWKDERW